jgi:hypothetical protein
MRPVGRGPAWVGPFVFATGLTTAAVGALFAYRWVTDDLFAPADESRRP